MFIPVSITLGDVSVDCQLTASGTLIAECTVTYEGVVYPPLAEVEVRRGETITLTTSTSVETDVAVLVEGSSYTWYIRQAGATKYVSGFGHQNLTGTARAPLVFADGTQLALTPGDPNEGEGLIALHLEHATSSLIVTNTVTGKYKAISLGAVPFDFIVLPDDGMPLEMDPYILVATQGTIVGIDKNFNIIHTRTLTHNRVNQAAAYPGVGMFHMHGDSVGLVFANVNAVYVESLYMTVNHELTLGGNPTGAPLNMSTGEVYVPWSAGIWLYNPTLVSPSYALRWNLSEVTSDSRLTLSATQKHIFAIDTATSMLHVVDRTQGPGTFTGDFAYLQEVPSSLLAVDEEGEAFVYVGYFDNHNVEKYNADLQLVETLTIGRTAHLAMVDGQLASTLVYSDAPQVTQAILPSAIYAPTVEQKLDKTVSVTYKHTADRALFATNLDPSVTITVNGQPFNGLLPKDATVVFTIPASSTYYEHRTFGLLGTATIVVNVNVEPKLFSDLVTLTRMYDANIRTDYFDEFEVVGMTEGFDVAISSSTQLMELSVNGAPFAPAGSMKLHDTVRLKWNMPRLGSSHYTVNNEVVTAFGVVVSSWPILKMELDGVELISPSSVERIKNYDYMEFDSAHESPAPSIIRGDRVGASVVSLTEGDTSVASKYAESALTSGAYKPAEIISIVAKNGELIRPVSYAGSDLDYTYTGNAQFKSEHQLNGLVASGSRTASMMPYTQTIFREVSREGFSVVLTAIPNIADNVQESYAVWGYGLTKEYYEAEATFTYRLGTSMYTASPLYDTKVTSVFVTVPPTTEVQDAEVRYVSTPEHVANNNVVRYVATPTYTRSAGMVRELVGVLYGNQLATSRVVVDSEGHFNNGLRKVIVQAEYAYSSNQSGVSWYAALDAVFKGATSESEFDVGAEVYGANSTHSSQAEVLLVRPESVQTTIAGHVVEGTRKYTGAAVIEFAPSHYRTVTIGGDGLFASRAAAELYAASLNLEGLAIIEPVGSVWQVRSAPLLANKECFAGQLELPDKTFGYLGGG